MEYWMASNETGHYGREETIQGILRNPGSAVLFADYPRWLLYFAAGCCILFMIVGIPGNLFTIVALLRTRKLRNATAIFIMNLSVSDLMFCCFNLPLATSTFWYGSWHHGSLLCRLFPLLRYGLVAVSLFSVLAITINRYVMIGHPRFYPTLYKPKYLIPMVLSTWIIAFGVLIVTWFESWGRFGLDVAIGSCSILPDINGRSPKEFLFIVAFLIPCIAIVVCYARIFYIVRRTAFRRRKKNTVVNRDAAEIHPERRSASLKNEEEELSILDSSCAASVLCTNFTSKCVITPPDRLSSSQTPSRLATEESSSEQSCWKQNSVREDDEEEDEEEEEEQEEEEEEEVLEKNRNEEEKKENSKEEEAVGKSIHDTSSPKIVQICDNEAKSSLEIKIDDIPYVDDLEANSDRMTMKESLERKSSTNARNKLETIASRASFIIDSGLWVHRLNSKASTCSDRFNTSRSNTPEQPIDTKASMVRRESKFKSVKRLKNPDSGLPRMSNKDKKLLKMILVIFSSFLICYLPITVIKTFKDAIDWRGLNIAGYILIYLTTCINPVVYVVMSSEYRSAYKNVLLCRSDSGVKRETRLRKNQS
ncbi:PREDICTED: G-protein coupled receptor moody [Habropoda laboriosa]|uniref:G-protein coupled receptor moody n=1 Tax=Habropoda laboriosa TaxID=597456 RepID=UPI00083D114C|nr:PREDICTED: G-protein coupled receptor moody [Habropoda laboriosa]